VLSIISFIVFAIVGAIARFLLYGATLDSLSSLTWQFLPTMLSLGVTAAVLAYIFPRVFSFILWFVPVDIGNS
jgi:hypothetical protein